MAGDKVEVDVHSLEDFRKTLDTRLSQVDTMLNRVRNNIGARPPMGTFTDGVRMADVHQSRRSDFLSRLGQMREAVVAAQKATDTIISTYHTTEARNRASSDDIGSRLTGVNNALGGH